MTSRYSFHENISVTIVLFSEMKKNRRGGVEAEGGSGGGGGGGGGGEGGEENRGFDGGEEGTESAR